MAWYYSDVRIYVVEDEDESSQIIARLQPIGSGSVHQTFGWESPTRSLRAYIVGNTAKDNLEAKSRGATAYVLSGPEGNLGNFYLSRVRFTRTPSVKQTLDYSLASDSPVYVVNLELLKE